MTSNTQRLKVVLVQGRTTMFDRDYMVNQSCLKNNYDKFDDEDFMFQLTKDEAENLSRCKKFHLEHENKERK